VAEGVANLFLEGQETEGLLEAAQGDVERVEVFGLAEEAVEAGLEEVQLVHEGGLVGQILPLVAVGQGAAEMLEVAGEGRGGDAILGPQGAQGQALEEGLVDFIPGSVVADSAAAIHGLAVSGLRFSVFSVRESGARLSGEGAKGQHGWEK
jgi:hypothetical protein